MPAFTSYTDPDTGELMTLPSANPIAAALYQQAYREFPQAFWNLAHSDHPNIAHVNSAAKALRLHGGLKGRAHAEKMEAAVRAAH